MSNSSPSDVQPPKIVTFGEIMARLAPPGFLRFGQAMPGSLEVTFAGAEASVAVSIAYLGGRSSFVTALPDQALGDACVANLRGLGVDTRHILRTPEGRMGLYFVEAGINQRPGNVIYDRENSAVAITPASRYPWAEIFEGASWFHISGITPALSRNAAEATRIAVAEAKARGLRISCDMNYRSKLWRWDPGVPPRELATRTLRELLPSVTVFLGGREDAAELLGIDPASPWPDAARAVAQLLPHLTHVGMTLRDSASASHQTWAGLLYDASQDAAFFAPQRDGRCEPYPLTQIVDRLGGGDAFAAALIFALTTPELSAPATAISFATAASALAHSIAGDFNRSTRSEIEALMAGAAPGRVLR